MRSRLTRFSARSAGEQSVRTAGREDDIQRTVGMPDAGTLAKLSDDAYFPGSILTKANWLVPIFEFPPAPVPINHGHKTSKGGRNRLRAAVLHPDTEPRRMFSFIDAGGWFAHFTRSRELCPP